eukprot:gene8350-9202_t
MAEQNEMSARTTQVDQLLSKKNYTEALVLCLQPLPGGGKSEEIKEANTVLIEKITTAASDADLAKAVNALSLEACDQLMKYVYKLMGRAKNCASMLKIHAQLVEKAGVGSIVRTLTDRRQV